jgi:hypothetical protein
MASFVFAVERRLHSEQRHVRFAVLPDLPGSQKVLVASASYTIRNFVP